MDELCPHCLADTVLGLLETHGIQEILDDEGHPENQGGKPESESNSGS